MYQFRYVFAVAILAVLSACQTTPNGAPHHTAANSSAKKSSLDAIKTIVVIYAENRSFDHLYGDFPGANGLRNLSGAQTTQLAVDIRTGTMLFELPPAFVARAEAAFAQVDLRG